MAVNSSSSGCYHFQPGSIPVREVITLARANPERDKRTLFERIIQPMLVELVGTTFFILIGLFGGCNDQANGNAFNAAFSFGLSLMIFVAGLGHISGTHFNPAVTVGVFIAGAIEMKKALLYVPMQLIGGIMAAGIFRLLAPTTTYRYCQGGATVLLSIVNSTEVNGLARDRLQWWQGLSIELLLTFAFVSVILMVAVDHKSKTDLAPVYIGLALGVCILASNALTGGSLNPSRSLGPAIFANVWSHHYIYWVGPMLGGAVAGSVYRFLWKTTDQQLSHHQ